MAERKRIIVGVAGGIAAYKAATVVRQLTEAGHSVRVVPTDSALRFIGAATFEALSGNPVSTRYRTSASARRPTSSSSHRPPLTCWRARWRAVPTTC